MRKKHYSLSKGMAASDTIYIYAFVSLVFVKVGIARDWQQRLNNLRGENPFPVHKVTARSIPHYLAPIAEHRAHVLLKAFHHRGEWFRCTPRQARDAVLQAMAEVRKADTKPGDSPEYLAAAEKAVKLADAYRAAFIAGQQFTGQFLHSGLGDSGKLIE